MFEFQIFRRFTTDDELMPPPKIVQDNVGVLRMQVTRQDNQERYSLGFEAPSACLREHMEIEVEGAEKVSGYLMGPLSMKKILDKDFRLESKSRSYNVSFSGGRHTVNIERQGQRPGVFGAYHPDSTSVRLFIANRSDRLMGLQFGLAVFDRLWSTLPKYQYYWSQTFLSSPSMLIIREAQKHGRAYVGAEALELFESRVSAPSASQQLRPLIDLLAQKAPIITEYRGRMLASRDFLSDSGTVNVSLLMDRFTDTIAVLS